jgi:dUTP pyrophosphatase
VSRVRVRVARVRPGGDGDLPLPAPATRGSSGADLRAAVDEELWLAPGERRAIPTGIAVEIPPGYEGQLRARSGLALEHGISLPNAPGTIDSDYRGELRVILLNGGEKPFRVARGDRIAQLVIAPVASADWQEVPALEQSGRGAGGFGHTGR